MRNILSRRTRATALVVALVMLVASAAWAARDWAREAGLVYVRGHGAPTETVVAVTAAAAVAIPTTALTGRGEVWITVIKAETDLLYCSIGGTPVATAAGTWSVQLAGGDQVVMRVDDGVVVRCITDAGTTQVHITEWPGGAA